MKRHSQNKRKLIIGITGSFGSGKTTVAKLFHSYGTQILDADKIAHQLLLPGTKVYKKIIKAFGLEILKKNKIIDRLKLAAVVFNNKNLLKRLNRIVHPEVIQVIKRKINKSTKRIIILDVPLLIEAGLRRFVDKLIVVTIKPKKQIQRLLAKTSLDKNLIVKRINAQTPLKKKVRLADFVIDNSGSIANTRRQVEKALKELRFILDATRQGINSPPFLLSQESMGAH